MMNLLLFFFIIARLSILENKLLNFPIFLLFHSFVEFVGFSFFLNIRSSRKNSTSDINTL